MSYNATNDLDIQLPENILLKPNITILGIGGAGCNAVNNMIESKLSGVNFVIANTDAQSLSFSQCANKMQLGINATKGLGAGSSPELGKISAEESLEDIQKFLENTNMLFITAGMGGGTGTGASSVIAKIAKELDILTIAVITKPFDFEGKKRMHTAEEGIKELEKYVDTLVIIPNQNLFRIVDEKTSLQNAFKIADDILYSGVRSITDLITMPGLINLDFADIKTIIKESGAAMMGTGEASGENRAIEAAESAITNPLLDNSFMTGAKGVLINITGGSDMTLYEVDTSASRIMSEINNDSVHIIFGSTFDKELEGVLRVSVVATGIKKIDSNKIMNKNLTIGEEKKELETKINDFYYKNNSKHSEQSSQEFFTRDNDQKVMSEITEKHNYNNNEKQPKHYVDIGHKPEPDIKEYNNVYSEMDKDSNNISSDTGKGLKFNQLLYENDNAVYKVQNANNATEKFSQSNTKATKPSFFKRLFSSRDKKAEITMPNANNTSHNLNKYMKEDNVNQNSSQRSEVQEFPDFFDQEDRHNN